MKIQIYSHTAGKNQQVGKVAETEDERMEEHDILLAYMIARDHPDMPRNHKKSTRATYEAANISILSSSAEYNERQRRLYS